MGLSVIQEQHQLIIDLIKNITRGDWKILILDETSKKIIDNVLKEDDILNHNIANIERIEERRDMNPTMDAIYLLSPQPHIVECLLADLDRKRYRRTFLVWTSSLGNQLRQRIDNAPTARQLIAGFETLALDFYPREAQLVTFRDPWSFPLLYHPGCNGLVRQHMEDLAQKIAGVCIVAGEYPKVRYYRPRNPTHEASVLCMHLARFVQDNLDEYARQNRDFPPPSTRPQSVLVVTDRSMDLMAPLVHEFTYQAMAHDLLPIKEGEKTLFHMVITDGSSATEEKDMELHEKDSVWVDNRHRHMKDTIDKLMGDFQKFLAQNPHFTEEANGGKATSLNAIKDMMAGLPQFQEMKDAYSLHLTMAQECMNKFQQQKLPDVASAEQAMATGLDEDHRKPRNMLDQVVRLLDDDAIPKEDRLRLIILYALYRDGIIAEDVRRLLAHSGLPPVTFDTFANLELLGGHPVRANLKDVRPAPVPIFPIDPKNAAGANGTGAGAGANEEEEYSLSRFEPAVRQMLDHLCRGQLDQAVFPYVNPPLDPNEDGAAALANMASLRAAKPSWAGTNRRVPDNRQRLFVFVAGGATFSEARACYEASTRHNRDVVLATSHMLTPTLFLRQLADLSANYRQLDIPLLRPPQKPPAHIFEREQPPPPPKPMAPPPAAAPVPRRPPVPPAPSPAPTPANEWPSGVHPGGGPPTAQMGQMSLSGGSGGKPHKDKKKRNIFGMKK